MDQVAATTAGCLQVDHGKHIPQQTRGGGVAVVQPIRVGRLMGFAAEHFHHVSWIETVIKMALFAIHNDLVDFVEVKLLDSCHTIQNRTAFLQETRAAKWGQNLHRGVAADILVVVDGVDDSPGVFTFHIFCCDRNLNRAGARQIGGHLQCAVAVLGGGDIVIKAILIEISAEVAVHTGE